MSKNIFKENKIYLFDGAMGTMLQKAGMSLGEKPELLNVYNPKLIVEIHKKYVDSGADIITSNTFGANEIKLADNRYSVEEIVEAAVRNAKLASNNKLVALDVGPTGKLIGMGELTFERAYDVFKRQVVAGEKAGADIVLIETMTDMQEARAAILAAKENTELPVFCTMTFQEDKRTLMGTDPATMTMVLQGLGADAVGVNCSLGPKEITPIVEEILKHADVPVLVQPNAGMPKIVDGRTIYDVTPRDFAENAAVLANMGVRLIGGCCGTTPEFIERVRQCIGGIRPVKQEKKHIAAVCSSTRTVLFDGPTRFIGDRINPTGKKNFKEALDSGDFSCMIEEALNENNSGADILDINLGLPKTDEKGNMVKLIRMLNNIIKAPLQIDSSNGDVIEAAVREYNGKPVINSVNGSQASLKRILPIVKKYGTMVIGLLIDENGLPATIEERVNIAGRIINEAESMGIHRNNIIIDTVVLTACTNQSAVLDCIKAAQVIRSKFNVKTMIGLSNVSYGLPNRALLDRTLLAMALYSGMDACIINPLDEDIVETIKACNVLCGFDKDAVQYIKFNRGKNDMRCIDSVQGKNSLKELIMKGLIEESVKEASKLLKENDAEKIVNESMIPALDEVGDMYDRKQAFLPELLACSEAVNQVFKLMKESNGPGEQINKGTIVLATVQGDIHDIGKNIVKLLLENYGYEVVDLGKDVAPEKIVQVIRERNAKLVGLSALMTTTVGSMERTIEVVRRSVPDCGIMVGGAVLTEDYAKMIGADYYAGDARAGVRIAQMIFKG